MIENSKDFKSKHTLQRSRMFGLVVRLLFLMSFFCVGLSCYQCFIDPDDSVRLCWGHILSEYKIRNIDACFKTLDRIFNNNPRVIEAAKVGKTFNLRRIVMS